MAFFNDLVRAIAETEGMDIMTVRGIGIKIREAGYITKGGRGLSAAQMTPSDAANLIIAVNASVQAKDAGLIVHPYRELPLTSIEPKRLWSGSLPDDADFLDTLFIDHPNLGGMLEALIEAATPVNSTKSRLEDESPSITGFEIHFQRPLPVAVIQIWDNDGEFFDDDFMPDLLYEAVFGDRSRLQHPRGTHDRTDRTSISARTLLAVGRVLAN